MSYARHILGRFKSPTVEGGPSCMRSFVELGMCRSRWLAAASIFGVIASAAMLTNPLTIHYGLYPWGLIVSHGLMLGGIALMLAAHGRWTCAAAQWYQFLAAAVIVTGTSLLLGFYSLAPFFIPGLVLAMVGTTSAIAVPTSRLVCLVILSWVMTGVGVRISGVDNALELVRHFGGGRSAEFTRNSPATAFALILATAMLLPTFASILGIAANLWYQRNYRERRKAQVTIIRQTRRAEMLQHRADALLDRALTKPVADIIRRNEKFPPELREVCVIACDIENFSVACEQMPSQMIVDELQKFFAMFDACCADLKVEPLRSQGDSRLALAGLFPQEGEKKRRPAVDAVLAMIRFRNRLTSGEARHFWSVRIGIHMGPVMAGVMDGSRLCFDVWGETVNIAARLEQAGRREGAEPSNRILVSNKVLWGLCGLFEHGPSSEMVVKNTTISSAAEIFNISPAYRNEQGEPNDAFWRVYENDHAVPVPPRAGWAVQKQTPALPPATPPPTPPTMAPPPPASPPISLLPTSVTPKSDALQPPKPS